MIAQLRQQLTTQQLMRLSNFKCDYDPKHIPCKFHCLSFVAYKHLEFPFGPPLGHTSLPFLTFALSLNKMGAFPSYTSSDGVKKF